MYPGNAWYTVSPRSRKFPLIPTHKRRSSANVLAVGCGSILWQPPSPIMELITSPTEAASGQITNEGEGDVVWGEKIPREIVKLT